MLISNFAFKDYLYEKIEIYILFIYFFMLKEINDLFLSYIKI